MNKVEYGDINKFLVSIGMALIAISFLAPYLYLKEDFGLYVDVATLNKYQPEVQHLINDKLDKVSFIQKNILGVCIAVLASGVLSVIIGLVRWFHWQAIVDKKFEKELEKLGLEIQALTPTQVMEKAKVEVEEIEADNKEESISKPKEESIVIQYLRIEESVISRFEAYQSPNFDVLAHQRLGNRYEIDLILRAIPNSYLDRIVEIKYFRGMLSESIIAQTLMKLKNTLAYYKENLHRTAVPVLLLIYEDDKFDIQKIGEIEDKISELITDIRLLKRLKVEFINSKHINEFEVRHLLKR